jgi:tetratricopeptide (TPR) repeat protein
MNNLPQLPDTSDMPEQLLASGNYAYAFHKASEGETKACARIMCGAIFGGMTELADCEELTEPAQLIQAYGYWCLGQPDKALDILTKLEGEKASKLAGFIDQGAEVLICTSPGSEQMESFENISLSYQIVEPEEFGDVILEKSPGRDLSRDLILSFGVYGANLPSNIFDLDCPTVFWVGDHDFFYATRQADFDRATLLVANSAGEHVELSEHYGARIAAFPGHESYGRNDEFMDVTVDKEFDIGYTGRAFVPYMRDKAQFLFSLATLDDPDLKIGIFDGYLAEDDFAVMMRQSKFVPLYWRYAGGIQTRAIDALRQGAFVFSPEPLTMGELLGGDAAGFVSVCSDAPSKLATENLADYDERLKSYTDQEEKFSRQFKDMFWPSPAREHRFIKFCLFQSILAEPQGKKAPPPGPLPAELRGYSPDQAIKVYTSISKFNMAAEDKSVAHYNFAATAAFYAATVGSGSEKLAHHALEVYALGQEAFPGNMVLKFNHARALWTFGAKPEASLLFGELSRTSSALYFDPKDAVLSHRMRPLADLFSYGDFLQAALKDPATARVMIQSAALTYLGVLAFETDQPNEARAFFDKATDLSEVNFPAYRWLTEVLAHISAEPVEILEAFYQAFTLYPPNLCQLLPFGVAAELASDHSEEAASLLNQWVLYHLRVREPSGESLPLNLQSLDTVHQNRPLLKNWIGDAFDQMMQDTAH